MNAATLSELRKELKGFPKERLIEICTRLARYKKDNKELLTYLIYETEDEPAYRRHLVSELEDLFSTLPGGNQYYIKKGLRRILRRINKLIAYSGQTETEIEVRIRFCQLMRDQKISLTSGTVLGNIYSLQKRKIEKIYSKLDEDLQADYSPSIEAL